MNGKEHIIFATATAASIAYATQGIDSAIFTHPYIMVGSCALGSLLPDIDESESTVGKLLFPISILIEKFFGHRMLIHDVMFQLPILIAGFIYAFVSGNPIVFGLALGILTHLFLDGLTKMGIPVGSLIWKEKRYSFSQVSAKYYIHFVPQALTVKSGSILSFIETIVLSAGVMGASGYITSNFLI